MKPVLTIIGGGMGDPALLTHAARQAILGAERVFAASRLADSLGGLRPGIQPGTVAEISHALAQQPADAVVLVSGDAGFFSLSSLLTRQLAEVYHIQVLNGLSSLQYLCGRRNIPYSDVKIVSLHGREGGLAGPISYHSKVFALTGGKQSVAGILSELCGLGLGFVTVTVGENLSQPGERITTGTAHQLHTKEFGALAVMLVENPRPATPFRRLRDEDFVRGGVPMTKEAVRALTVDRLEVAPGNIVWDIGAGTGSVSIALAQAACDGMVYAVEREREGVELIHANKAKLGVYNLAVVEALAPDGLEHLPLPDRVLIGGSGGRMEDILDWLTARSHGFTLCLNAVTLDSLSGGVAALERRGFADIEVECVNIAKAKTVGGYRMMLAHNPVHLISGRWAP